MRLSLAWDHRGRLLLGAAVWGGALAAALMLYRGGAPPAAAVAVVQARQHAVAPVRLGRLLALEVGEGERVTRGQVIARFDTAPMEQQVSLAEAKLEEAARSVAATDGALEGGDQQAGRAFRAEADAVEVELGNARSSQAREQAELTKLSEDMARERDLVRRGLTVSDRLVAMDQRRASLEEAVRAWPARLGALESRAAAARERLAAWDRAHAMGANASKNTRLRPVEAKVRAQRESVSLLRGRVEQSTLVANIDGIVSLVHARPGAVVKPGDPVVTLVEARPRQALAFIDERRGGPLAPGTRIVARRRGELTGAGWPAEITHLAPDVSELPERLRLNPMMPAWGRAMYITLPMGAEVAAGELLEVATVAQPPASPVRQALLRWSGR